jgi:hypothetical protein
MIGEATAADAVGGMIEISELRDVRGEAGAVTGRDLADLVSGDPELLGGGHGGGTC